jgi:hypothetical protein
VGEHKTKKCEVCERIARFFYLISCNRTSSISLIQVNSNMLRRSCRVERNQLARLVELGTEPPSPKEEQSMDQTKEERIREKAHSMWEQEGRPEGQDSRHWEEAEKQLVEADSVAAGQPSKDPKREPRDH